MQTTVVVPPETEDSCVDTQAPPAPPIIQLVDPTHELRLAPDLRAAAQTRDPHGQILPRAAEAFYRATHLPPPPAGAPSRTPAQESELRDSFLRRGNAFADLAVTGRVSYGRLRTTPLDEAAVAAATSVRLGMSGAPTTAVADAVGMALDRAYAVAWALRGPAAQRPALRAALGWLAVSGEDDKPHRPVNVGAPKYEQFEIPVTTQGLLGPVTLQTRFFIASAVEGPAPAPIPPATRALPPEPVPHVPAGHRVILFLHGDCSGAEEALTIVPYLHAAGLAHGTKYAVVSVDLPNGGYSETVNHDKVAASSATTFPGGLLDDGTQIGTPILDFVEDFVVAFVDALDPLTQGAVKNRFAGVIGGSLGGNLGLRLGRRPLAANPWLAAGIVSWDAASVWSPMVGGLVGEAPKHCRGAWDLPEVTSGVPGQDSRTMHFKEVYDQPAITLFTTQSAGPVGGGPTQPEMWYRDGWLCKAAHIEGSRTARQEIYDANYRRWHWRLSGEQLVYSHVDNIRHGDSSSPKRYQLNTVRHLLVAGAIDDYFGSKIYTRTQELAGDMAATPGGGLMMKETGHSIHVERPKFFAGQIADFFERMRPNPTGIASWGTNRVDVFALGGDGQAFHKAWDGTAWRPTATGWEALGGTFTSPPTVVSWGDSRLDVFGLGTDHAMYHKAWDAGWHPSVKGWEGLGGVFNSAPAVVAWGANRLDLFALGTDAQMWHKSWDGTAWRPSVSGWEALGGKFSSPPGAVAWGPNRLDVFAVGVDDQMWHMAWDGAQWQAAWQALGGSFTSPPAAVAWDANRLDVFGLGTDSQVWHKAWDGAWHPSQAAWEPLGGVFTSTPAVASRGADRLDIVGRGTDKQLWHKAWDGRGWRPSPTDWEPLGGFFASGPAIVSRGVDRLDVFGRGSDDQLHHKDWLGISPPAGTAWETLGPCVEPVIAHKTRLPRPRRKTGGLG